MLAALTARGVHVGVVTNSLAATDVYAVHSGYAEYRDRLLRQGVHLHELRAHRACAGTAPHRQSGASLHTKAFVLDDARGFVGSFNVDPRSKNLNTEMGVLFDDPVMAPQLRDEYLRLTDPAMSYWVYRNAEGEAALAGPSAAIARRPRARTRRRASGGAPWRGWPAGCRSNRSCRQHGGHTLAAIGPERTATPLRTCAQVPSLECQREDAQRSARSAVAEVAVEHHVLRTYRRQRQAAR